MSDENQLSRRTILQSGALLASGVTLGTPIVAAQDSEDAVSIECGETIAGELTPDDPEGFRDALHYYDTYTFEATADEFVTIDMIAPEPEDLEGIDEFEEFDEDELVDELTEEDFIEILDIFDEDEEEAIEFIEQFIDEFGDPYLYLLTPDGEILTEDDDTGFFFNSRIRQRIPETGEYTIIATSFGPENFFEYDLSLECQPFEEIIGEVDTIECGDTVSGELTPDDTSGFRGPDQYHDAYSFEGEAGEFVTVSLESDGDPYLYLLDPDGVVIAEDDDSGGELNSLLTTALPSDGEYLIVATSFAPEDFFEYDLSIECQPFREVLGPLQMVECGDTVTGELTSDDATGFRGSDHYHDAYCFDAEQGGNVTISLSAEGDTYLYLVDPAGQTVAEDDDSGGDLDSLIADHQLEEPGLYYIISTSFSPESFFEYELTLECDF